MKQFLLLFFSALLTLGADAQTRTFTDNLVVDMGGTTGTTAPLTATVYLTEHDGKVDLELRNFVFKTPTVNTAVGHIKLSDLTVTEDGDKKRFSGKGKAKLTRGDLPGYFFWMSSLLSSLDMEADGYFTADSLNFALDFTVPFQGKMKVKYGRWTTTGVQTAVSAPADEAVYTLGGSKRSRLAAASTSWAAARWYAKHTMSARPALCTDHKCFTTPKRHRQLQVSVPFSLVSSKETKGTKGEASKKRKKGLILNYCRGQSGENAGKFVISPA